MSTAQPRALTNCYTTITQALSVPLNKLPLESDEMRHPRLKKIGFVLACIGGMVWYFHEPKPTMISLYIGQPFAEVVKGSTYPIRGGVEPGLDETGFGWTDVYKPSVILRFNDPQHGFTHPPTTFLAITYMDGVVATVATSPMLKKLPFDQAVELLGQLQQQFQRGGWQPWAGNGSVWFDLSPAGKKQLHDNLRDIRHGWAEEAWLIVPDKYGITFRIKCAANCDSKWGWIAV